MRNRILGRMFVGLLAMVAANFLYQAIGPEHWAAAFERSYFQAMVAGLLMFIVAGNVPQTAYR